MRIQKVAMKHLVIDSSTICATATPPGHGGIAVIRVSGPEAENILRKLTTFLPQPLESHRVYYGWLRSMDSTEASDPIDEVMVSYFQKGRSFTGETTFEISCHGSELICAEILQALCEAGCRMAGRGEFTYRAFMNGRIDLVQAEGVLDLIQSGSKRAANLALHQLQGDVSSRLRKILDQLTWILAHLEANIDFASEDIQVASHKELAGKGDVLLKEIDAILASYKSGSIIRNGFRVALVGRPNVGKSSLLNALVGEEKAIVTNIPGTTRDFVESEFSIEGVRVSLIDTAGLRITEDPVEKIGVSRTLEKMKDVELILYVLDQSEALCADDTRYFDLVPWEKTILIGNKSDLGGRIDGIEKKIPGEFPIYIEVSALSQNGLEDVRREIKNKLKREVSGDSTLLSSARHFQGLSMTRSSLIKALELLHDEESPDFIALELQEALQSLHEILGITFDDQVMDRVFNEFCLGK
jgi:tRNA modification GTPase